MSARLALRLSDHRLLHTSPHAGATVTTAYSDALCARVVLKTYCTRALARYGLEGVVWSERDVLVRLGSQRVPGVPWLVGAWGTAGAVVVAMTLVDVGERRAGVRGVYAEARDLTRRLVCVLEGVYSAGVVHCDLVARNLVVGERGVGLVDFGSACFVGGGTGRDWGRIVSPEVCAPECLDGAAISGAVDVWGLGVLVGRLTDRVNGTAKDFVEECCRVVPAERLGCSVGQDGAVVVDYARVKTHPFLSES